MKGKIREREIMALLRDAGELSVLEMANRFGVSEMTIRRDLAELEHRGVLVRTYGGARSLSQEVGDESYNDRASEALSLKAAIANAARAYIKPGIHVFVDSGTTTWALAKSLPRDLEAHITTNDVGIAYHLLTYPKIQLSIVGGIVRQIQHSIIGSTAVEMIHAMNAEIAFIGVNGFSLQRGFTTVNPFDADVKHAMITRADHVIILADSTKAGKVRSYPVSALGKGHHLISDSGLSEEFRTELEKAGIRVEIVEVPTSRG
jgi:DeoR/GlpR family transcriptional regulator of sugar metabolism